ncbi:MAG: DNA gyrase subunit A, partial [Anaerolineae bacterium]
DAEPVLVVLLKQTQMQGSFGINMLALVDGEPRVLSLKRILVCHIEHRQLVLTRRTQFELDKALARAHILEGLLKALDMLDEVIATIRHSKTADTALTNLMEKFKFSEIQARAILDMQLRRLAALERQRIQDEYRDVKERIAYLQALLKNKDKILGLVKADILALKATFGDARRTRIIASGGEGTLFDNMVPDEESLVLITMGGQAKRLPLAGIHMEEGQLVPGISPQEADALRWLLTAHSRDTLYFIGSSGHAQVLAAHQVPDIAQMDRGLPLKNLVHLANDEHLVSVLALNSLPEDRYLTLFTRQGKVKRVILSELSSLGAGGIVIGVAEEDALLTAFVTSGQQELLVVTADGRALRFKEEEVRPQGRPGSGMRAIALAEGDEVIGADIVQPKGQLVLASQQAYAKRCAAAEFNLQGRGGQGMSAVDTAKQKEAGPLAYALVAPETADLVFVTTGLRMVLRTVKQIPELPRNSWGRIISSSHKGAVLILGDDKLGGMFMLPADIPGGPETPHPVERRGESAPPERAMTEELIPTVKNEKPSAPKGSQASKPAASTVTTAPKVTAKSQAKASAAPAKQAAVSASKTAEPKPVVKTPKAPAPKEQGKNQAARAVTPAGPSRPAIKPAATKVKAGSAVAEEPKVSKVTRSAKPTAVNSAAPAQAPAKTGAAKPEAKAVKTAAGTPAAKGSAKTPAVKTAKASPAPSAAPTANKETAKPKENKVTARTAPAAQPKPAVASRPTTKTPASGATTHEPTAQAVPPAPTQDELPIGGIAGRGRQVVTRKPQRTPTSRTPKEKE